MAYIFQADIYCDDCGKALCESLGTKPQEPFDSDDYPKDVGDSGEADCPQHCANGPDCLNAVDIGSGFMVGELVSHELTMDGVEYVKEAIDDDWTCADYWRQEFADYLD